MLSPRSLAIARTGARLLISDPAPIVVNLIMPLILTAFLIPATRAQLRADGVVGATGAEQVVPGMAVMFAFLSTSLIGTLFFREHAWGTWERLRASSASTMDIVVGKVAPLFVAQLLQVAVLFVAGRWLFGYRPKGSPVALAAIAVMFVAMLVSYGVMLVAVFATMDQAVVIGNLGGMLMAGLGGALAPITALPEWVRTIAHATPAYWALDGLRTVTLRDAGLADVTTPLLVLAGFTAAFLAIAALRFRPSDSKIGTT